MRPISLRHASAPSPALLKFLRAQTEAQTFPRHCAKASRSRATFSTTPSAASDVSTRSCFTPTVKVPSPSLFCPSRAPTALAACRPTASADLSASKNIYLVRRTFTSTSAAGFWERWARTRKHGTPLQPNDLPHRDGYMHDESGNLSRIVRPVNELKIRCTEFDENGNVTLVNGEFRKSELIAKYGLLPRDLRKIDSSMLPHILIRPSAILMNLLHLRVLIKHNRVLVFDAYGTTNSYTQSVFMYDLEGRLRQKDLRQNGALPYEFRALEAVLISVTSGLESEFEGVREPVVRVLRELEEDIDRDKLRYLLIYSKKLGSFEQQARLVRDALDELLEADDDLAAMYLTEKAEGKQRGEHDHSEVELLLESYHKVADEIVQAAENLVSNIRNTEEIVKAILDANRNSLMLLELKFAVMTLGLAAGTFIAALYGMNLKNFIEESDLGFWGVSAWCTVFTLITTYVGLGRLRRVQRVSMWGEHGRSNKGSWRDLGEAGIMAPVTRPTLVPPVGAAAAVSMSSGNGAAAAAAAEVAAHKVKLRRIRERQQEHNKDMQSEMQAARRTLHQAKGMEREAEKVIRETEQSAAR